MEEDEVEDEEEEVVEEKGWVDSGGEKDDESELAVLGLAPGWSSPERSGAS